MSIFGCHTEQISLWPLDPRLRDLGRGGVYSLFRGLWRGKERGKVGEKREAAPERQTESWRGGVEQSTLQGHRLGGALAAAALRPVLGIITTAVSSRWSLFCQSSLETVSAVVT